MTLLVKCLWRSVAHLGEGEPRSEMGYNDCMNFICPPDECKFVCSFVTEKYSYSVNVMQHIWIIQVGVVEMQVALREQYNHI